MENKSPRVRFCWHCGNKLRGNHFVEKKIEGHDRILHKECAKNPQFKTTDYERLAANEDGQ